jgi:hypothetical protein
MEAHRLCQKTGGWKRQIVKESDKGLKGSGILIQYAHKTATREAFEPVFVRHLTAD